MSKQLVEVFKLGTNRYFYTQEINSKIEELRRKYENNIDFYSFRVLNVTIAGNVGQDAIILYEI